MIIVFTYIRTKNQVIQKKFRASGKQKKRTHFNKIKQLNTNKITKKDYV